MLRRRAHTQIDRVEPQSIDDALIAQDDVIWCSSGSGSGALCELEGGILCVSLGLCVEEGLGCAARGQESESKEGDESERVEGMGGASGWHSEYHSRWELLSSMRRVTQ